MYDPIEFESSTCDHDSKPTEFDSLSFEAEHLKPDSECMDHCPLIHIPSTTPTDEPSLEEGHSSPISFPPPPTIDPPPHSRQSGNILLTALDFSVQPAPLRSKSAPKATQGSIRTIDYFFRPESSQARTLVADGPVPRRRKAILQDDDEEELPKSSLPLTSSSPD